MDKQIIKNIIIEKQIAIPNYKLVHRDFLFGDKSNYILVGIRRAGKSYLLYQDIQTRLNKGEQSAQDILYINFEDERLSSLKAEELGTILDSYMELYPGRALKKVPNFKLHSLFLNFNSCPRSISSFKSGILFWTGI